MVRPGPKFRAFDASKYSGLFVSLFGQLGLYTIVSRWFSQFHEIKFSTIFSITVNNSVIGKYL